MFGAIAGFDWDEGNREKCGKHGVTVEVIESLFTQPIAVLRDSVHSQVEERQKAIGKTVDGRGVLIVFTIREQQGRTLIRPISARYMHMKEVRYYEKTITETGE